jgi:glutathione S-transferase
MSMSKPNGFYEINALFACTGSVYELGMTHTRPKLYFSPGTVSMAAHIALEELGAPYELEALDVRAGEQYGERYQRIHPLGRVPALEIEPGVVLTETPALLGYLADLAPELMLLPREPLGRARASEWMSLLASSLHVAFLSFYRPGRYTSDVAAQSALKVDGKQRFFDLLRYVERRLPAEGFVLGERYSLCDAYLAVFLLWAKRMDGPLAELPRYVRLVGRVLERPAVRRALEQEGLAVTLSVPA